MSHISECYYKTKVEKTEKTGNTYTHICTYELKDGGYLVFKDVKEMSKEEGLDYIYDGKKVETFAMASDNPPDDMVKEEKSENLKKLLSVIKNMG
jgi:hypothetical protein